MSQSSLSESPELLSEMPGKLAADLASVQIPEVCKGLQGSHKSGVEVGMQCPTTSKSLWSGPQLLLRQRSRAATLPTHLNGSCMGASLTAHVSVVEVPSPSSFYRAKI